jgi:hypothetical protein
MSQSPATPIATPNSQNEDPSTLQAFTNIANQVGDQIKQVVSDGAQVATDIKKDLADNFVQFVAGTVIDKLDENSVTTRYTVDFGGAAMAVKSLLSGSEESREPIGGFISDWVGSTVIGKAYDAFQDKVVELGTRGMDVPTKLNTMFNSTILPYVLTPNILVDNFDKFMGVVDDEMKKTGEH